MAIDRTALKKSQEFSHILARIPQYEPTVILDVGANVGENAEAYATIFPDAVIHAFEPVPATHAALIARVGSRPNVKVHNLALSDREGSVRMWTKDTSPGAFIIKDPKKHYKDEVEVKTRPGADLVRELGIEHISYLKIDAEGHDLEVLHGFGDTLERADFIQVEAGMNPHNKHHVPFRVLEDVLRAHGFLLFQIYEPSFEFFHGGHPVLRRMNPLFINGRMVDLSAFG